MKFWGIRLGSIALAVVAALLIGMVAQQVGTTGSRLIALAGLYVTLAVSLNLINGITGQFSIGHAAFYQVGAYTAAFMATQAFAGRPITATYLLMMIGISAVAAGIAGLLIGLPSLRLKGDYLAIVTLGFGEILRIIVQNVQQLGGSYGINVNKANPTELVPMIWLLAMLCIAMCRNLLQTAQGLSFLSVREDEVASGAMGVNVTKTKVTAFVIGSAFAGAAGALLAHNEGFINPQSFGMDVSFIILTMVVLGGTGSITGSVVAALALFTLPELLRDAPAMPLNGIIGTLVGISMLVGVIKLAMDNRSLGREVWSSRVMAGIGIALVVGVAASFLTNMIPALANRTIAAAELRMVIFSAVLIIVMLLRPQGIFGHREFSLAALFGKRLETGVRA